MTYHQTAESGTQSTSSLDAFASAEPRPPLVILEQMLEDVRRALTHDRKVAQAGIARLSAMLEGKEIVPAIPGYIRGGFAPWQKRRIEAYLAERLEQSIPIKTLAQMVSLSESHFCRAFKRSFGDTPHAYLMRLRIERAKQLMISTREPLSQIGLACGLSDQSHFSKVFLRCVGHPPAVWRRMHAEEV